MREREAALKRYYRSIRSELPCPWNLRTRILRDIRGSVEVYLTENPEADFAAIEAHFGNAHTIASSYIDAQDTAELLWKVHIKKRVISMVAGVLAVALLIWGAAVIWAVMNAADSNNGRLVEIIVVEKTP